MTIQTLQNWLDTTYTMVHSNSVKRNLFKQLTVTVKDLSDHDQGHGEKLKASWAKLI